MPLANLMVDRLQAAGVLNRGAAYWYGRALHLGARSPLEAVERLTALPTEKLGPLSPEMEAQPARRRPRRGPRRDGRAEVAHRPAGRAAQASSRWRPTPHKYVIVATGNIYDDAVQARAAAQAGADIIAVIRSTAQSLLDYVPHGATTEGYGGTYATQENFRIMREALDDESRKLKRYIQLTNYSSGLCMAEIAWCAALERLDMLLNDAMYGILFRDINMRRTFVDQYFSRRICALAGIIINTGEDNYLTTADAVDAAHTVLASQFINECFAQARGPARTGSWASATRTRSTRTARDTLLLELAQAQLVRRCSPTRRSSTCRRPSTRRRTSSSATRTTRCSTWSASGRGRASSCSGMLTEAMHTPLLADRYVALKAARYIHRAARGIDDEFTVREDGKIANRAR